MIRLVIAFLCAAAACMLVASALTTAQAPANPTPDPFVSQITRSNSDSFAGDISANGRFVVIESAGDIATEKTATRNNQDGNREIFLFDYAQRRIWQLTNTRHVLNPPGSPSPTPSPSPSPSPSVSPSPTASPTPTPVDLTNVAIEVSNNEPMISLEPGLVAGSRSYTIVFSSNAPGPNGPASFDGTNPGGTIATDMNQEIWTYKFTVPEITQAALASGAEVGPVDLLTGTYTRITNTPASAPPVAGSTTTTPRVSHDNREASISDDGTVIAFTSNRDIVAGGNVDADAVPASVANPEVFLYRPATGTFTQVTNTKSTSLNDPIFSSNPCLNSNGSVLAFISNSNLVTTNTDLNAEVYLANFNSATGVVSGLKQVTKTLNDTATHATVNGFQFGRRLSRDGKFIAFESAAADPKANAAPTKFPVAFVYDVSADTFAQVGPRALDAPGDILHFPTFTDYDAALRPASVIFTSALNFNTDGSFPTAAQDPTTGLNTRHFEQLFLAPLPAISTGPFSRLSNIPNFVAVRGIPSNTRSRMVISLSGVELGGGNSDGSVEAFYQLIPTILTESPGTLTASTGASKITVPVASPTATLSASPSPSPTPTASPSPGIALGFAAGELAFVQPSVSLPTTSATVSNSNASEAGRAPALPIELSGVSVAINNAACGLYAVSSGEIKFVAPVALLPGTYPIVINNNGTVFRGSIVIVAAQPDIFTSTNGPLGRAQVCNITNPLVCSPEPFTVTTNDGTGAQVPTVLRVSLTGIRGAAASTVTVTVGTTAIVATAARSLDLPGNDQVDIILPATVDTGDLPIVVTIGTASSRPKDTAPHITINAGGSPNPNPIVTTDYFVRQQYLDFLNREPDALGFAFWTNQINSCGADQQCIEVKRINVSAAFFISVEFQQTGYLVYRTYKAAYGDIAGTPVPLRLSEFLPDTRQIGHDVVVNQSGWETLLESNKQAFFSDFVQRSRFTTAFASGLTAQQFVDKLYTNVGLAPASGTNRAAAVSEFNSTTPADAAARARALRLVAEDPMVAQQEFNRAFVLMEYFGYLQRNPNDAPEATLDFGGYNFWLTKLNQFNGNFVNAEMVKAFITSTEYKQRFGL
jgi:uncharacterized protein (TIGR03437 family)